MVENIVIYRTMVRYGTIPYCTVPYLFGRETGIMFLIVNTVKPVYVPYVQHIIITIDHNYHISYRTVQYGKVFTIT